MEKKKMGNDLLGGGKEKFIETSSLRITGHLLQWEDVAIQISNISIISTANIQLPRFPVWAVIAAVIGLALVDVLKMVSLLVLALACVVIYFWYSETEKKKKLKALTISLNSGEIFSIIFTDAAFLKRVLSVFSNIFEEGPTHATYVVDIQNCKIDNGSSFIKEGKA